MAEIELENVAFTYDGKKNALDGVTLSIERGEFVCVIGGNGSGKSTLAKHLNGLIVPDSGAVRVNGAATSDKAGVYAARQYVGMVFQNPDDALVETLVADDVAFGPRNLGLPADEVRARVAAALHDVGLAGYEGRDTIALSGGQKQRVAIAGILAMRPHVLVLDEASAMLDPQGRRDILQVVSDLHKSGMTIVAVTHSMEEVAAYATRVVVLERGAVAYDGTPEDLFSNDAAVQALSLDLPFSVRLRKSLADQGIHVDAPLSSTPEALASAIVAAMPSDA